MSGERELLGRATEAIERIDLTLARQEEAFERQQKAFERMMRRWDENDARAELRHRQLLERQERSERIFIEAMSDIDASIQRNTDRLDTMGAAIDDTRDAIQANTRAVLSVLDRLERPGEPPV
jgi:hypothetical protein